MLDILIVEDEEAHSEAIRRSIGSAEMRSTLRQAASLEEFRHALERKTPDIALMDLNLPDGRAVDVLTHPPEEGAFPVLIMTSHGTQESAVEAMKAGALDYVIKSPDTFADMPHTIERALKQWQLLRQHRQAELELEQHRYHLEELVRLRTQEVSRKTLLLESINRVLMEAITSETEEDLWQTCLNVAEQLTESKFGQIGELNAQGLFDIKAISNPGWDLCAIPIEEARESITDLPLRGIDRATILDGKPRIVNSEDEFARHPDHVELPEGHPKLTSFLGVPLKQGPRVTGMIGLGNKEDGYTLQDQENVEALSVSLMQVISFKRAEATIKGLNESLRQRTEQLAYTNMELKAFTSTVSHDLRSPLRGISRYSSKLRDALGPQLESSSGALIDGITGEASRLSNLIDSLLELSRVSQADMHKIEFDMSALAESILERHVSSEPDRKIQWHVQQGLTAEGDPLLMRQVLENLLENAVKFTGKRDEAHIEFGVQQTNGQTTYYVKDNGAGFDPEEAENIFKPFRRLHTSGEFPGTGVGLSTVDRIIRRHGGRVWYDSTIDRGTIFYFTLE